MKNYKRKKTIVKLKNWWNEINNTKKYQKEKFNNTALDISNSLMKLDIDKRMDVLKKIQQRTLILSQKEMKTFEDTTKIYKHNINKFNS